MQAAPKDQLLQPSTPSPTASPPSLPLQSPLPLIDAETETCSTTHIPDDRSNAPHVPSLQPPRLAAVLRLPGLPALLRPRKSNTCPLRPLVPKDTVLPEPLGQADISPYPAPGQTGELTSSSFLLTRQSQQRICTVQRSRQPALQKHRTSSSNVERGVGGEVLRRPTATSKITWETSSRGD